MCSRAMTFLSPVAVQKMSPTSAARARGGDLEAVHQCLERAHRVDLGHDHVRAHPARSHRNAATHPAVAGDHELPSREEDVRRPDDSVDRGLARAVAVVEEVLVVGLVDGHDRIRELALRLEGLGGG